MSEVIFSLQIHRDGTLDVGFEHKVIRLKPKNPAILLLPIMSTLLVAMGSQPVLQQKVKDLCQTLEPSRK